MQALRPLDPHGSHCLLNPAASKMVPEGPLDVDGGKDLGTEQRGGSGEAWGDLTENTKGFSHKRQFGLQVAEDAMRVQKSELRGEQEKRAARLGE